MTKRYPFASRYEGGINRWKSNLQTAMQRDAHRRQCPTCGRKSALRRIQLPGEQAIWVCRWTDCRWEGTAEDRATLIAKKD